MIIGELNILSLFSSVVESFSSQVNLVSIFTEVTVLEREKRARSPNGENQEPILLVMGSCDN